MKNLAQAMLGIVLVPVWLLIMFVGFFYFLGRGVWDEAASRK